MAKFIDVAGMILLAIGVVCYGRAYVGLEALRANGIAAGEVQFANLTEYERLNQVARLGLGIAAFAIVVFTIGAVWTWRAKRNAPVSETMPLLES